MENEFCGFVMIQSKKISIDSIKIAIIGFSLRIYDICHNFDYILHYYDMFW